MGISHDGAGAGFAVRFGLLLPAWPLGTGYVGRGRDRLVLRV